MPPRHTECSGWGHRKAPEARAQLSLSERSFQKRRNQISALWRSTRVVCLWWRAEGQTFALEEVSERQLLEGSESLGWGEQLASGARASEWAGKATPRPCGDLKFGRPVQTRQGDPGGGSDRVDFRPWREVPSQASHGAEACCTRVCLQR